MSRPAPYVADRDFELYIGDALGALFELDDRCVHCVVTSPPYWGLRDYEQTAEWQGGDNPDCDHLEPIRARPRSTLEGGQATTDAASLAAVARKTCRRCGAQRVDQQLGLEAHPDEYVARLVEVFREVRRVLRDDGTLWLNIGDTYNAGREGGHAGGGRQAELDRHAGIDRSGVNAQGLKPKDLIGVPGGSPSRFKLTAGGSRSDVIWAKPNPLPESVTDRPTKAHEYLFLLAKSRRYYFDQEAVREPIKLEEAITLGVVNQGPGRERELEQRVYERICGANVRSVWEIPTSPYAEAHFATMPEELARRCIRAGTSERGTCPKCGTPWERELERSVENRRDGGTGMSPRSDGGRACNADRYATTLGWTPGCSCDPELEPRPATVLDPFMGAGTTALAARSLGRHAIGVELNATYAALCARRLQQLTIAL